MNTRLAFVSLGTAAVLLTACDSGTPDPRIKMEEETATAPEPAGPQVEALLAGREDLSTFASLIDTAGMGPAIEGASSFTLLVPNNDAFEAMEPDVRAFLTDPANANSLRAALGYHMLRSPTSAEEITASIEGGAERQADFTTSNSYPLAARLTDDGNVEFFNNRSSGQVVEADIQAANGMVHVIDGVLVVPDSRSGEIAAEGGN